ncbi:hypothetical protein HSX11_28530 [Oxalobacteraceae bacterium]|nr:hypothetical protein [Oxalobacteraceae bacterium]
MMTPASNKKLAQFYNFFETYGTERLNGLSESYFIDLDEDEKKEAWNFLKDGFWLSSERITGLYIMDNVKAIDLFKEIIDLPMASSPYPAEQREMESNRLLMLRYINRMEPEEKYFSAMSEFSHSEFERVRAEFAQYLPAHQITRSAVDALKGMVFTETETIPLTSAITKLMLIHGMDFDRKNPLYKSIYLSLKSDVHKEKIAGMKRLEEIQIPDYI